MRASKSAILLVIFTIFLNTPAFAYWIWTPKTGKWINPKSQPKPTPTEQFKFAKDLYDLGKIDEAVREFRKVLKAYPKSAEAAESQYYLGIIEKKRGNLYTAYKELQKVIDKYPFSERIPEIIQLEYDIAEAFMAGEKRKFLGMRVPAENPAIEIFQQVVDNATYGPLAPKAQYKLGLVLKSLLRYYEAEEVFNKVVSSYPDTEWASAAKFQLAECRAAVSRGPEYDQGAAKEAKEQFAEFVREHPDAALSKEAEKNLEKLKQKELESNYGIARFYEKQKDYQAAKIYYNEIIERFPKTIWAEKSKERIKIMETQNEK